MKLELATAKDSQEILEWVKAKGDAGYSTEDIVDFRAQQFLKVEGQFYVPLKSVVFLGPLIPNPNAGGKLGRSLVGMKNELQKLTPCDIVYVNVEDNGVDKLAEAVGFQRIAGEIMILPGATHDVQRSE